MSPTGRPKGEYRKAQPDGTPVTPPGRPQGDYRKAQPEGAPVCAPGTWPARIPPCTAWRTVR